MLGSEFAAHKSFLFEGGIFNFRGLLYILESQGVAWFNFIVP